MKKIMISTVLFSASLGVLSQAYAACPPIDNYYQTFRTLDISMAVGRVVVRPSDYVGKVLVKKYFPINPNGSEYQCDRNGGTLIATLSQNHAISSVGDSVYSTNIPGIGIRLYREAQNASNFSGYYPYSRSAVVDTKYFLASGYFIVEIIKTAENTGSGTLVPGRYSAYNMQGYSAKPWLTSTVYGNAITIASSSCEIKDNANRTIYLDTVNTAGFKGVGSTQAEQAFNMQILCNGGENTTGYEEKNQISLTYDFLQDGTNNQVLENTVNAKERANGVAVQLLWNGQNNKGVIKNGHNFSLGTLNSNQTLTYNIPMSARYIQSATKMTAGKVRGMATMTIQYD